MLQMLDSSQQTEDLQSCTAAKALATQKQTGFEGCSLPAVVWGGQASKPGLNTGGCGARAGLALRQLDQGSDRCEVLCYSTGQRSHFQWAAVLDGRQMAGSWFPLQPSGAVWALGSPQALLLTGDVVCDFVWPCPCLLRAHATSVNSA
jgi:hypothetical protein